VGGAGSAAVRHGVLVSGKASAGAAPGQAGNGLSLIACRVSLISYFFILSQ